MANVADSNVLIYGTILAIKDVFDRESHALTSKDVLVFDGNGMATVRFPIEEFSDDLIEGETLAWFATPSAWTPNAGRANVRYRPTRPFESKDLDTLSKLVAA